MKKAALLLAFAMLFSCAKKPAVMTHILTFNGAVTVNSAPAADNKTIGFGDVIETGKDSFCVVQINEKSVIKIGAESKLVYKVSATDNTLELERGWLAGLTRKVFTSRGKYTVQSPTVTASIRGTSFCAKVEKPESTYFCVCNGEIEMKKPGDEKGDMISSAHHTARRYTKGKDGAIAIDQNPGLLYHNDSGIEELARLIGEKIDWTTPDRH